MGTTLSWTILIQLLPVLVRGYDNVGFDGWYQPVPHRPVDIITDVINDLGVRILQQYTVHGNVAFSPAGVGFVLAALYEGSAGRGRQQISDALGLPRDPDVTRLGFRDIHRRLRTYLNADGFLGGLTLNQENTRLRPDYEDILRFYGFDLTVPEDETNGTGATPESTTNPPTTESKTLSPDDGTVADTQQPMQETTDASPSTTPPVEILGTTMVTGDASSRLTQTTLGPTILMEATEPATLPSQTTVSSTTVSEIATAITSATDASSPTTVSVPPATVLDAATQSTATESLATSTTSISPATDLPAATTEAVTEAATASQTTVVQETSPDTAAPAETTTVVAATAAETTTVVATTATETTTIIATTVPATAATTASVTTVTTAPVTTVTTAPVTTVTEATAAASNVADGSTIPVAANQEATGPPADENAISTDSMNNQTVSDEIGSTDLPAAVAAGETGSNGQSTTVASTVSDSMTRRKRAASSPRGFFSSYPDEGIWMQDLGIWNPYPASLGEAAVRDSTEISFLVNGCDVSSVTASRYFAVLPFAHFPSLHAVALEFPLDDPRYNILLVMSTDRRDTYRLARDLGGKSLRLLRKQLQATWVRATIPSFMLRGFVTLTSFLERLGIVDVFEPRAADLSLMTPDLGVYARDVQQSIGVNIRNYMKPDRTHSRNGLFERAGPVLFTAVHPFLYFIVDAETSVALIAGRVNDPLNSRIL